jgi:hypothetical protein
MKTLWCLHKYPIYHVAKNLSKFDASYLIHTIHSLQTWLLRIPIFYAKAPKLRLGRFGNVCETRITKLYIKRQQWQNKCQCVNFFMLVICQTYGIQPFQQDGL